MKPFVELKLPIQGNVLSYEDTKLFLDIPNPVPNPKKAELVIKKAEEYLEQPIPQLPLSLFREFHTIGNRSNYEASFFKRRDMMTALAVAEGLEGKGRFTDKLADVVWAVLEESTWVIPAHLYTYPYQRYDGVCPVIGEETLHGIDLFSATTASSLCFVKRFAAEALNGISKTIMQRVEHEINQRIIKPYLQCPFWWTGESGNKINNWAPWVTGNILYVCSTFVKDMAIRERIMTKAIGTVDNFVNGYAPDGGCDEGPSYWSAAGAALFDCLELIEDLSGGKLTVYGNELIKNIGDYIYKVNIHDNYFVNFADCGPKVTPSAPMLIRFGKKCGSPFLVAFGKRMAKYPSLGISHGQGYRGLKNLYEDIPTFEECDMPTVSSLPDLGVMTARECADSAKGLFLAAKGGTNAESHNHNDVGNFIVYRDGAPVIIDVGVGTYTKQTFSPQRYELWFMQSGYHNLPSFDGVDQHNGRQYAAKDQVIDEESRTLCADITDAYLPEAGIEHYKRSVSLGDGCVTVKESFAYKTEGKHLTDFHFMSHVEPLIESEGRIKLNQGMVLTYPDTLTAEIEAVEPKGLNAKGAWGTDTLWRIHLRTEASRGELVFKVEKGE